MKLQSFRRLFKGDYEDKDQPLVEKMSPTINNGIEVLYNVLNKNVSLKDNISGTYKEILVTVNASGVPTGSSGFQMENGTRALGLQVIRVEDQTNINAFPTGGVLCSFAQNGNLVSITNITGLISGHSYKIRLFAYADS